MISSVYFTFIYISVFELATFQERNRHMWSLATLLDKMHRSHFSAGVDVERPTMPDS